MSKVKAIETAKKLAKKKGETMHVVWDVIDVDFEYLVTDDEGLETFHMGADVIFSVN